KPDLLELARAHAARLREGSERLVDGLDLARPLEPAAQPREASNAPGARYQRKRMNRCIAEHERQVGEMRRREREALLRKRLKAAGCCRWGRHGSEPKERAQRLLVLQRDRRAGLVAFDEVEQMLAELCAIGPIERLGGALEPALGRLGVVTALARQRQ